MNGRYVRLTPSRSAKAFFALARSATILVMSTSWVCVNCAVACRDSRVFFAVIWRIRLAFWVVPRRRGGGSGRRFGRCSGCCGRGGRCLLRLFPGLTGGQHVLLADPAADAGAL